MKAEKRFRELKIERKAIDEESRTVELAFSSEEPYERSFGIEVLDHEQGSADLSRLHNGAPLLVNHDPNDQIGVVENARVDDDKVGRATVRFGKSERAQEIFGDVSDGIRRLVSVGYQVKQVDKAERDKDGLATYRVSSCRAVEMSENCLAWIKLQELSLPITNANHKWHWFLQDAKKELEYEVWPDDCIRHSFCSYGLRHSGNAAKVALQAGQQGRRREVLEHLP